MYCMYSILKELSWGFLAPRESFYPLEGSVTPIEDACNKLKEKPPPGL